MNDLINRRGRFRVSENFIWDCLNGDISGVASLFEGMIVVRAEAMFVHAAIEYTAYSPQFDPVAGHDETPAYDFTIKVGQSENGDILRFVTFQRRS